MWVIWDTKTDRQTSVAGYFTKESCYLAIIGYLERQIKGGRPDINMIGCVPKYLGEPKNAAPELTAEQLARSFHEIYERLAPVFGYETREDTKVFDPNSKNGKLMIAVCTEMAILIEKQLSKI